MATTVNAIRVNTMTIDTYMRADLYKDGLLQVSIDDNVMVDVQLHLGASTISDAKVVLLRTLGQVGAAMHIREEGKDF